MLVIPSGVCHKEQEACVVYLVTFSRDYPVLFECLYAVFGAMMSNSRLVEQIHGMLRSNLRSQVGMDQADHHRQFSAHQEYKMREARRKIADESGEKRDKQKKALKHDKTNEQKVMIGRQMIKLAEETEEMIKTELEPDEVPTMSYWNDERGRRAQDKENLSNEIMYEDTKSSRLTRTHLTIDAVRQKALITKPTNDAMFEFNEMVILWHEKVEAMCVGTFWDTVKPNSEYRRLWKIVRKSFIWIDCLPYYETVKVKKDGVNGGKSFKVMKELERKYQTAEGKMTCYNWGDDGSALYARGSIYRSIITSKSAAKSIVADYIATTKALTTHIYSFLKKADGGTIITNKSLKKTDIYFMFVRYVEEAWGEDVIEPAVNVAFNSSRAVDPHFKYILKDDGDVEIDDDAYENSGIGSSGGDSNIGMGDIGEDDMF